MIDVWASTYKAYKNGEISLEYGNKKIEIPNKIEWCDTAINCFTKMKKDIVNSYTGSVTLLYKTTFIMEDFPINLAEVIFMLLGDIKALDDDYQNKCHAREVEAGIEEYHKLINEIGDSSESEISEDKYERLMEFEDKFDALKLPEHYTDEIRKKFCTDGIESKTMKVGLTISEINKVIQWFTELNTSRKADMEE